MLLLGGGGLFETRSNEVVEPQQGKKSVHCWICVVDTHASKDCKLHHYCLVCVNTAQPTFRCPTLKHLKETTFFTDVVMSPSAQVIAASFKK
jgi:hypothetical protein